MLVIEVTRFSALTVLSRPSWHHDADVGSLGDMRRSLAGRAELAEREVGAEQTRRRQVHPPMDLPPSLPGLSGRRTGVARELLGELPVLLRDPAAVRLGLDLLGAGAVVAGQRPEAEPAEA